MRRLAVFAAVASLLGTWAGSALAAGDCPEGDWFCEPAPAPPPPPAQGQPPAPPPRGEARPAEPPPPPLYPPPPGYEDDGEMRFDEPPPPPPPMRRHRRYYREWGLNMHATIGLLGGDSAMSPNADMNGFGTALRFRPIPYVAVEPSLELVWGTDYNGYQRFEDALLVNGLFYANPFSAVQLYGIAGLGVAAAHLDDNGQTPLRDHNYRYFGGQLGVGVEGRITRHFALGADLIGFLRARTDANANQNPEFTDASGHTTNTSTGGLLRLGATFYW